jgi:hypothetical protein
VVDVDIVAIVAIVVLREHKESKDLGGTLDLKAI